ncbi:MAG: MgtC/SapB family protein [Halanaeroarchaeum sp.]
MLDTIGSPLLDLGVRLSIAFVVGVLIGLEREQSESGGTFAGVRTFPLFALVGALVQEFFPSLLPVAVLALAVPLTVAYSGKVWIEHDIGLTTLTAAVLTIVLGALTTHSRRGLVVAVVVGGVVTIVLSAKHTLHGFVDRIDEREREASLKFILVVFVILPILPNRELDVLFGLNPQFVWLMVAFVSGLSFVAYVLSRAIGPIRGYAVTGLLGGFVSSTATTVSMAERSTETPSLYRICAFATVTASIVMFPRALVEVAVVNPALLPHVVVPLGAMTLAGSLVAAIVYWRSTEEPVEDVDIRNPFRLRPALLFGAAFAVVLLVAESATTWFGASGLYATAFFSGLADVDAITLTVSTLARDGAISREVATTGIVIGALANTLVKAGLAWVLGTRRLGRLVIAVLGVVALVGILVVIAT